MRIGLERIGVELSENPVTLTVTSNLVHAEMISSMLEIEGIRSMIQQADGLNVVNGGLSDRQRLLVLPGDLERARELMARENLS